MYNQENYNTFSEIRKKRMYEKNDNAEDASEENRTCCKK